MPRYSATVRLFDVDAADKTRAQHELEQRLQDAKLGRCIVVQVAADPLPLPMRQATPPSGSISPEALGPVLLMVATGWAFWFYWLILG